MAKHFRNPWLWLRCQASTGPNLLLCVELPDFSTQRHHSSPTSSSLQTGKLLSKVYSHPEGSLKGTQRLLCDLSQQRKVAVQRVHAHCGVAGNEEVDCLAKPGREQEQLNLEISYGEAKALIKQLFSQKWMQAHDPPSDDQMHHLPRYQQTTIFRLRTGHCHLCSHLYCPGPVAHTRLPVQNVLHILEHIL